MVDPCACLAEHASGSGFMVCKLGFRVRKQDCFSIRVSRLAAYECDSCSKVTLSLYALHPDCKELHISQSRTWPQTLNSCPRL